MKPLPKEVSEILQSLARERPAPKGKQTPKVAAKVDAVPAVAKVEKSRALKITRDPTKTEDRQFADLVSDGIALNATTAIRFSEQDHPDLSLTEMVNSLQAAGESVNSGDMASLERMLTAQAVSLNVVYAEMARRAALNMGSNLHVTEAYLRLALRAQSQSRATAETVGALKNPPVVFARQANINNGGQQQVNNGPAPVAPAHAAEKETLENKVQG